MERELTPAAVSALTASALATLPVESLGPTKALLKRFFSSGDWGDADDEALADAVGPGAGWWHKRLDAGLVLEFGWIGGRFVLRADGAEEGARPGSSPARPGPLEAGFEGPIVPEATPNPRTIAFRTGHILEGGSRSYRAGEEAADVRVARLFGRFPDLATVLVSAEFVALTLRRADRWEALLAPVLEAVTEEFAGGGEPARRGAAGGPVARTTSGTGPPEAPPARRETRLDRAWHELGALRPADPSDLDRLLAAAAGEDVARRQVAATLLGEAHFDVARAEWARLVEDPSRVVRRAVVDAVVDAGREELRPLLERALGDADAWVRWKALRGLAELGPGASSGVIESLASDPDFRVRLEARTALGR